MPTQPTSKLLFKKLALSWHKALTRLLPFGGYSYHNRVHIFHDGDAAFAQIFAAIDHAQHSIFIETYILAPDGIGQYLRAGLLAAKLRGVDITILYDHLGSSGLTHAYLQPMIKAGIRVVAFNPIWPWRRRGPLLFRNHRKIIVIDEHVAFCGSMNLSEDYAGPIYGNNRFRDTVARIDGPAVTDLLTITKESIAESALERSLDGAIVEIERKIDISSAIRLLLHRLTTKKEPLQLKPDHNGTFVQVVRSNQRRNLSHIQRSMEEIVNRSVEYCYFTTPYFLPHDNLRKALINAQRRGVDVRILTAGISDVPLMRLASHHVYTGFLRAGIRIYEMTKKTLHAKIATIDGVFSSVGSYNLDHWSARRNLEVNLSFIDQNIAVDLKQQFDVDLESSQEIDKTRFFARSLFRRFLCWLAYLLLRI